MNIWTNFGNFDQTFYLHIVLNIILLTRYISYKLDLLYLIYFKLHFIQTIFQTNFGQLTVFTCLSKKTKKNVLLLFFKRKLVLLFFLNEKTIFKYFF